MILCCGEALIDMLPRVTTLGENAYAPYAGGAIFNTAIALGRIGIEGGGGEIVKPVQCRADPVCRSDLAALAAPDHAPFQLCHAILPRKCLSCIRAARGNRSRGKAEDLANACIPA